MHIFHCECLPFLPKISLCSVFSPLPNHHHHHSVLLNCFLCICIRGYAFCEMIAKRSQGQKLVCLSVCLWRCVSDDDVSDIDYDDAVVFMILFSVICFFLLDKYAHIRTQNIKWKRILELLLWVFLSRFFFSSSLLPSFCFSFRWFCIMSTEYFPNRRFWLYGKWNPKVIIWHHIQWRSAMFK